MLLGLRAAPKNEKPAWAAAYAGMLLGRRFADYVPSELLAGALTHRSAIAAHTVEAEADVVGDRSVIETGA